MRPLLSIGIDGDPIGVGIVNVLVRRVGIGARQHHHIQFAAAGHQIAEGIGVLHPLAAIVQRNFGGVIGHATAGAETGGVGVSPREVVEPKVEVVLARVVFGQGQLGPAHGAFEPGSGFRGGCGESIGFTRQGDGGTGESGGPQKVPSSEGSIGHMAG